MNLEQLQRLARGEVQPQAERSLVAQTLADPTHACALGITPHNAEARVQGQIKLLQQVYPDLEKLSRDRNFDAAWLETAWRLWLPLAVQLHDRYQTSRYQTSRYQTSRQAISRLWVQGILGSQGTGKTTLSRILILLLRSLGLTAVSLSIDDLYKTYAERRQLQKVDPRLLWRGPPGTHDVALGLEVLAKLRQTGQAMLPRFDKALHNGAGDRVAPELVAAVDLVLFEGWFVGMRPIDPSRFETAPPPIVTPADRAFAHDCNARLEEYVPLWEQLDSLIVLCPEDYRYSKQWRRQAEVEMGKGMDAGEVDRFVEYFWKALHPDLFLQPLVATTTTDLVIEIDRHHRPGAMYRGGKRDA